MPVEDLVNVAEHDLVLAFHAGRHRHFTLIDRLHVALQSTAFEQGVKLPAGSGRQALSGIQGWNP